MRPLVLLWGCLMLPGYEALTGPKEVRGFEGDTVSLQCTYEEKLRNNLKYWCKTAGVFLPRCSNSISTSRDGRKRTEGRVSIQDSPSELRFNVTLRKLALQDAGEYWCGVQILGFDETVKVSLIVLPGPPSPTPFVQPLARSLQPKAKAWQTQPPDLRTSRPSKDPDSTTAKDTSPIPSSSIAKSRAYRQKVRILAPVLVLLTLLLTLLLAAGLAALGRYMLRWRKEVQLATETQRNEKVHVSHSTLSNGLVPEYAVINVAAHTGPAASSQPCADPCPETLCLSQTSEGEETSFQNPGCEASLGPPLHLSEEELRLSTFISV